MINDILEKRSITKYRLSKLSGVPYTTINDICCGRTDIAKCSAGTVYKIAGVLGVTMEELVAPYSEERPDFELFKSDVCHKLKDKGDTDFLIDLLESDIMVEYYEKKWYPEALYLLAMLDYVSKENDIPICSKFDEMRKCRLSKPVYPASVIAMNAASKNDTAKKEALKYAIPEFLRFNIVESEVRDVV